MLGRTEEALREFQKVPADDYHRLVGEAAISARAGQRDEALRAIPALERRYGDSAYYQFAQVYAQTGLIAQGVEAIRISWAKRDPGLASVQADPFLDPLRKDASVSAIAAQVFQ
jgi:serine/threonine-protein kinase